MAPTYLSGTTITQVEETDKIVEEPKKSYRHSGPTKSSLNQPKRKSIFEFETPLKWVNLISISLYHIYCVYCMITFPLLKWKLWLWGIFVGGLAGFGVTAGVHRFWCHRTYKAKLPLRIILMICYSIAGQNTIYDWVRDHRVHHKFSDTDADPHNANRGFFFSHVGWLMMRKHPEVLRRGRQIDMSDILADPVVQFSQKYFIPLKILFCFFLPVIIPVLWWDEYWYHAFTSQAVARYVLSLNFTWSVNSAAHIWGYKPYDKKIKPAENLAVALVAMGEGWHNYHHVFPWDYKAAELGNYSVNTTTMILDMFSKIGWAYDLKEPSKELVMKVMARNNNHLPEHEEIPEEADQEFKTNKSS